MTYVVEFQSLPSGWYRRRDNLRSHWFSAGSRVSRCGMLRRSPLDLELGGVVPAHPDDLDRCLSCAGFKALDERREERSTKPPSERAGQRGGILTGGAPEPASGSLAVIDGEARGGATLPNRDLPVKEFAIVTVRQPSDMAIEVEVAASPTLATDPQALFERFTFGLKIAAERSGWDLDRVIAEVAISFDRQDVSRLGNLRVIDCQSDADPILSNKAKCNTGENEDGGQDG